MLSVKQAANAQKLNESNLSKSKEERSKLGEQHNEGNFLLKLSKWCSCVMLMESKPWTIYWYPQDQKKEHLNRLREIQFRETSADTERIKYNTSRIRTGFLKNIDLLWSREGTAEFSGRTRLRNTSVEVH